MHSQSISKQHQKSLTVLGLYFRELRLTYGLTQHELGDDINVHIRTIQRFEAGKNVTMHTILRIADYFGVDIINELFTDNAIKSIENY